MQAARQALAFNRTPHPLRGLSIRKPAHGGHVQEAAGRWDYAGGGLYAVSAVQLQHDGELAERAMEAGKEDGQGEADYLERN